MILGAIKSNDNVAHGGQRYELDIQALGSKNVWPIKKLKIQSF